MPEELKSFLISVSVILTIALFIPCIESIARLIRRDSRQRVPAEIAEIKPAKSPRRNARISEALAPAASGPTFPQDRWEGLSSSPPPTIEGGSR